MNDPRARRLVLLYDDVQGAQTLRRRRVLDSTFVLRVSADPNDSIGVADLVGAFVGEFTPDGELVPFRLDATETEPSDDLGRELRALVAELETAARSPEQAASLASRLRALLEEIREPATEETTT